MLKNGKSQQHFGGGRWLFRKNQPFRLYKTMEKNTSKKFTKPDILETILSEGIEVNQRNNRHWACCPFHTERTPSLMVDLQKQRFKCFGCGESGDSIDFIQKLKNLTFRDALKYLGIGGVVVNHVAVVNPQKLIKSAFEKWASGYAGELCDVVRVANRIDKSVTPESLKNMPNLSDIYLVREISQYHLDILDTENTAAQIALWREESCQN